MFYSDCIVLKLRVVFLLVMPMAKQVVLFDSLNMAFNIFRLEVTNKESSSTKPNITRIEISTSEIFPRKEKQFFWNTKIFSDIGKKVKRAGKI